MLECYEFSKNLSSDFYQVVIPDTIMTASKITLTTRLIVIGYFNRPKIVSDKDVTIKLFLKCLVKFKTFFGQK